MAIQEAVRAPLRIETAGLDPSFDPWAHGSAWAAKATCRGSTHLFFAPDRERPGRRARREAAARELCARCPVLTPCRTWAREYREYGFWGGESEDERASAGYRPVLANGLTAPPRDS
jgi:WhiB family redox-sensing transcriptional regulator